METESKPVWLCRVHQLCWTPGKGGLRYEWRYISLPGRTKEEVKNRFSQDDFQIWDIYDLHRINRCAIAEQHCVDYAEDPFDCHHQNL